MISIYKNGMRFGYIWNLEKAVYEIENDLRTLNLYVHRYIRLEGPFLKW